MKLYLVHCGFYLQDAGDGVFESHANFFVVAESAEEAKLAAKEIPEFVFHRMHVDGIQEIQAVAGHRITLVEEKGLNGATLITSYRHRELAPRR